MPLGGHEGLLVKIVNDGTDTYRMLEKSSYISELGVAFEKGTHQELSEQLTKVLETMKTDGSIEQIAEKYGLDAEKVIGGGWSRE
jgi:polar amino acid transport system substrate-binding protein